MEDELGQPVPNATCDIKRVNNVTGEYISISTEITDGNGQFSIWLYSEQAYHFTITKQSYIQSGSRYWIPTALLYTKTFMLEFEDPPISSDKVYNEEITFNGYINRTTSVLYVNYSDNLNETIDTQIYIYEYNYSTQTETLFHSDSRTGENSFQISESINNSNKITLGQLMIDLSVNLAHLTGADNRSAYSRISHLVSRISLHASRFTRYILLFPEGFKVSSKPVF